MELDAFGRGVPHAWIAFGDRAGRYADQGFVYGPSPTGGLDLTLGPDGRRVLGAFHRAVAAAAASGMNVICEAIVHDEADRQDWADALGGTAAIWVRLTAALEVLEGREQADRSRIFQGLARGMSARSLMGTWDVEGDSGVESVDELVDRVRELVVREQPN